MPLKGSIARVCLQCGQTFGISPRKAEQGFGKYCSLACRGKAKSRPVAERFWEKVEKTDSCWLWTGAKHAFGYGLFGFDSRTNDIRTAHRSSWELHYGPVPEGMNVLHACDVPACVRPDHLFLGTFADNTQDMIRKRRDRAVTHPERQTRGEASPHAKLTEDQVREIRHRFANGEKGYRRFAAEYGVSRTLIDMIVHREAWAHLP